MTCIIKILAPLMCSMVCTNGTITIKKAVEKNICKMEMEKRERKSQ